MPTFDEVFLNSIRELRASHEAALIGGSIKSMENYKQICGFLQGLDAAEAEYKRIVSAVDGDDSL